MTNILKVGVAAAVLALGAGCTDLKPLQAEVDSLKSQVARLSGDMDGVKTAADGASRAAAAAQQAATSAQNSANQALSAAQAAQQCCDANSAKMDQPIKNPAAALPHAKPALIATRCNEYARSRSGSGTRSARSALLAGM